MNSVNLIWFLLPLAALSGWLVCHVEMRRRKKSTAMTLPSAYFKGLNYLLNEQPDKAIEVFLRVLEVDADTVETHLALGSLFRRRGEVERAIRIHQNLIARPALKDAQRRHALLELGQDYSKAGLLDRAENLFAELLDTKEFADSAIRHLLDVYEKEKEWQRAIDAARHISKKSGEFRRDVVAQYYCELAEEALATDDLKPADIQVRKALKMDEDCVRASMLQGRIASQEGHHEDAIEAWTRIEQQDPVFLGEVAQHLAESYRALDNEQGLFDFITASYQRRPSIAILLAAADIIAEREGLAASEEFVVESLRTKPTVHGLYRLIELNLLKDGNRNKSDLVLLKGIIGELKKQHEGYICRQCGFKGKVLHWQCPGCKNWNTVVPLGEG